MLHQLWRNRNFIAIFHDAVMAGASFALALYLRLGEMLMPFAGHYVFSGAMVFTVVSMILFTNFRLYRGLWRYASMQDLFEITKAVSIAILVFYASMFVVNRLEGIPRSVPFIHWLLLLAMLGGPRFLYRMIKDSRSGIGLSLSDDRRIPVLVIGAGDNAELFVRETQRSGSAQYRVVGIIDDDPERIGRQMHGIKIYGPIDMLAKVVDKVAAKDTRPQKLLLAKRSFDGEMVRDLLAQSDRLSVPLARLPRLTDFADSVPDRIEVKPIAVEDVLGRAQRVHDRAPMEHLVRGKKVLITGAGGSIGAELTRQIARLSPQEILLYDMSEFALYQIDQEMTRIHPTLSRSAIIGDVRDDVHLGQVFAQHTPELVFHAAALKHVPLVEANIEEAILTNTIGTQHVAELAKKHKAEAMVLISTDKAVHPTNVMGACKRLAEHYCQVMGAEPNSDTQFITVRFGNVLGSTGSVVPLFQEQLERGGPITVTHPDMTRYFMTIREAVELVIHAAALGCVDKDDNGRIFVLDMGKPVKIKELAEQMIRLAGLVPEKDIELVFTGLRPGEKMYEELFYSEEALKDTDHDAIQLAMSKEVQGEDLKEKLASLKNLARTRKTDQALALLKVLVPDYKQSETPLHEVRTPGAEVL